MTRISTIGANGKLSAEFDSVGDVFRVARKLNWKTGGPGGKNGKESNASKSNGFHTFGSLAEAIDVYENKPDTIREFSVMDDRLESLESPGKDVLYDVVGDFVDIDRFLTGEPENMGYAVMGNPKSIFCTINVLTSFVHYTSTAYQVVKQKRILRIVDFLETQGIRCQIVAQDDSDVAFISTVVKQFQDPFDLNDLAVVTHPDWLRRVEFLVMEQSKTWQSGYGNALDYDDKMKKYQPEPEDGVYIYVGGYIPYGGSSNDTDKLNEAFDALEKKIVSLVNDGRTWNDEPFVISGGGRYDW